MSAWEAIRVVAGREIRERVRSRAFIISAALLLLMVVAAAVVVPLLAGGRDREHTVGMVGLGEGLARKALESLGDEMGREVRLRSFPDRSRGEEALREERVDAVVVDGDEVLVRRATGRSSALVEATTRILRIAAAAEAADGRADAVLREGLRGDAVSVRSVEPLDRERLAGLGLGGISAFILFFLVVGTSSLILTGVVEEKNSRVVELMVSAAGARNLLAGKVLGVAVLGLGLLALVLLPSLFGAVRAAAAGLLPPRWVAVAAPLVLWFLLGYAFFGYLLAAMGSLVSRVEDLQHTMAPVMLILLASFYAVIPVIPAPEGAAAVTLSFLPPTAPAVMLIRVAAGAAPWWQVVVAVAVMAAAILLVARLAARIYSVGILNTGQRLKFRQALRVGQP